MKFNADDHTDRFAPIVGQHRFRIEKVTTDFTQAGDPMLNFELKLLDAGRLHWERFIVKHSNPKVVDIAMGKLSLLSRAVECPRWNDEQELVGRVGEAIFGPQKDNADFTEIKRYVTGADLKGAPAANPHRDSATRGAAAANPKHREVTFGARPPAPPPEAYDDDVPF